MLVESEDSIHELTLHMDESTLPSHPPREKQDESSDGGVIDGDAKTGDGAVAFCVVFNSCANAELSVIMMIKRNTINKQQSLMARRSNRYGSSRMAW